MTTPPASTSLGDPEAEADNDSARPSIDDLARDVAFESVASNLVANPNDETNDSRNIFVANPGDLARPGRLPPDVGRPS
jgi:hypothetical protein